MLIRWDPEHKRSHFLMHRTRRPLIDEPLRVEDWRRVWDAHEAFLVQVRGVVWDARERAKREEMEKRACRL